MNETRVVHCKRNSYDIYIGRPSILGNPFSIGPGVDRERAIRLFAHYAVARMDMDPKFAAEIRECRGKTLGCWCSPKPCHGNVIMLLADRVEGVHEFAVRSRGIQGWIDLLFLRNRNCERSGGDKQMRKKPTMGRAANGAAQERRAATDSPLPRPEDTSAANRLPGAFLAPEEEDRESRY
jgi:hypothetical protein